MSVPISIQKFRFQLNRPANIRYRTMNQYVIPCKSFIGVVSCLDTRVLNELIEPFLFFFYWLKNAYNCFKLLPFKHLVAVVLFEL